MPRRIAIITHEYFPVLSGGTVFADKMAYEWSRLGHEVEILTGKVGRDSAGIETRDAFHVRRFQTGRRSIADATLGEHLSYFGLGFPQMLAYARKRRFELIFSIFAIPSGLVGLGIAKALGIPSFVFVDAADTPGVESAMKTYLRYLTPVFRFVTKRSTGVVVLQGLEDLAMPHIRNRNVTIIPNGTTLPSETARPGQNGDRLEILSIGRLVPRKGFTDIIRALDLVKKERSDFRLRIVGYGTNEEEIRNILAEHDVQDQVEMVGRVEYSALAAFYLSSDCYLFYGAREGSSLAMIEALSYGLPLVASDHPGNRTYVEHGKSGLLVEHNNPPALSRAILDLLEHKDRLAAMGSKGRRIAESYSWAEIARRYDSFFTSVTEQTSS